MIKIVDNSVEGSGINNYSKFLLEFLKDRYEVEYENIYYKNKDHFYINAVKSRLKYSLSRAEGDLGIFSNFLAVDRRFKHEILVVHDTFLWKYGSLYQKAFFFMLNIFNNMERVYVSRTTRDRYTYNKEERVIYPFLYESFYHARHFHGQGYVLTDYGNYPNKDPEYYMKVYKNNDDMKFVKLGFPIEMHNLFSPGFIEMSEIFYNYMNADFLLFLSRDEGFGYPMAQAGLIGLPVVLRDNEITREIYGEAKYYDNDVIGDNFKINREIIQDLIEDRQYLQDKRNEILERINPFLQIEKWSDLINQVMKE